MDQSDSDWSFQAHYHFDQSESLLSIQEGLQKEWEEELGFQSLDRYPAVWVLTALYPWRQIQQGPKGWRVCRSLVHLLIFYT